MDSGIRLDPVIGLSVGEYRLEEKLGRGAMGAVYRARHSETGALAAVKLLHPNFRVNQVVSRRFLREVDAAGRINHPCVVTTYGSGWEERLGLYLVMELLEGRPLKSALTEREAFPVSRLTRTMGQLCGALTASHAVGVVHRDIKPTNIILCGSQRRELLKLLDFGVARFLVSEETRLTGTGGFVGSLPYASPEQILGLKSVDHRSDLYSAGVVLYELLSGAKPHFAASAPLLASTKIQEEPDPVELHRPDLGGTRISGLLTRVLSKEPEDRPQTAEELWRELDRAFRELEERYLESTTVPGGGVLAGDAGAGRPGPGAEGGRPGSAEGEAPPPTLVDERLEFAEVTRRVPRPELGAPLYASPGEEMDLLARGIPGSAPVEAAAGMESADVTVRTPVSDPAVHPDDGPAPGGGHVPGPRGQAPSEDPGGWWAEAHPKVGGEPAADPTRRMGPEDLEKLFPPVGETGPEQVRTILLNDCEGETGQPRHPGGRAAAGEPGGGDPDDRSSGGD